MKESLVVGLVLVALLFGMAWLHAPGRPEEPAPEEIPKEEPAPPAPEEAPSGTPDGEITLRVLVDGAVEEMTLAEYLPGVVRGEMPPSFEMEALKAQAVAERTYVYYQLDQGPKKAHPEADVCTDPGCCSAYLSRETAEERWGSAFADCEARVSAAVTETDGYIALYEGRPIMAVFHSSSDGVTAGSGDVWEAELPYLVSVASPESGDSVPNYYSVKTVSREEFRAVFAAAHPEADFGGQWVRDRTENASGRVDHITVGGVTVTGAEMRRLYGLRSASFTVEEGEEITFRVTGYGHGVGLSQYGANVLAQQGMSWREILQWYYTDVNIGGYTNR